ncbi:MAG: nucleotidyltransferase family protein [Thermoguttaceae bacterium]|nr:nucleotidyltransferase family protein [Thermoguttaceae bacterium]
MNCVILAAGYATRLYPLTENFPKPLLKVGEKTIVDWLIDDVDRFGKIERFVVVTNAKFADFFYKWRDDKASGVDALVPSKAPIEVLNDGSTSNETRIGAVKDVLFAIEEANLSGDLLVLAGDNVLDFSLGAFLDYFERVDGDAIMRYYEPDPNKLRKCGVLELGENDLVLSMVEKPQEPKSNWCVPPFYAYRNLTATKLRDALEQGCGYDAPGSLAAWACANEKVYATLMPGKRFDVGDLESYNKISAEYRGFNE